MKTSDVGVEATFWGQKGVFGKNVVNGMMKILFGVYRPWCPVANDPLFFGVSFATGHHGLYDTGKEAVLSTAV